MDSVLTFCQVGDVRTGERGSQPSCADVQRPPVVSVAPTPRHPLMKMPHMCLVCDGYSHESAMQALETAIRVHGWALVQVEGDGEAWCYTVGLLANYGHPELTLIDVGTEHQRAIIEPLVESVQRSGRLPTNRLGFLKLRAVTVHDDHLAGELFGTWANVYGRFPSPGEMLQIVLPSEAYCSCHAPGVRRLDLAGPLPRRPEPRPMNRAERRRSRGRRS